MSNIVEATFDNIIKDVNEGNFFPCEVLKQVLKKANIKGEVAPIKHPVRKNDIGVHIEESGMYFKIVKTGKNNFDIITIKSNHFLVKPYSNISWTDACKMVYSMASRSDVLDVLETLSDLTPIEPFAISGDSMLTNKGLIEYLESIPDRWVNYRYLNKAIQTYKLQNGMYVELSHKFLLHYWDQGEELFDDVSGTINCEIMIDDTSKYFNDDRVNSGFRFVNGSFIPLQSLSSLDLTSDEVAQLTGDPYFRDSKSCISKKVCNAAYDKVAWVMPEGTEEGLLDFIKKVAVLPN